MGTYAVMFQKLFSIALPVVLGGPVLTCFTLQNSLIFLHFQ